MEIPDLSQKGSFECQHSQNSDVVELLRRAGVEFFRFPLSPEGKAMQDYLKSDNYIPCHFTNEEGRESFSASEVLQAFLQEVHPEDREYMSTVADRLLASDGFEGDITSRPFRGVSQQGRWSWYEVRMNVIRYNELLVCEGLMVNVDVQQVASLALQETLLHDQLTGLGNLKSAHHTLKHLLETNHLVSVIWIDLRGFGRLNTYLGRAKGDEILRATAMILKEWLQDGDYLFRPDSDEFLIVLPGRDPNAANSAAEDLLRHLPKSLDSHSDGFYGLSFYAGISSYPTHGQNEDIVLANAASALDQARRSSASTSSVVSFGEHISSRTSELLRLELCLRQAVDRDEFRLVFQPQWNPSGEIVGAEALLRWDSEELGLVSPGVFIPLAEQTGQIHQIGQWVIEASCRAISDLHQDAKIPPPISINISAHQLSSRKYDISGFIVLNLKRFGLKPNSIVVEITESGSLDDLAIKRLHRLHDEGLQLHVDDFGTGFASLSSLLSLPIHALKLDQSFVAQINASNSVLLDDAPTFGASVAILKASLALASSIGAEAVVEGVENSLQYKQLRDMGYQVFQGYYFAKPLEFIDYCQLLESQESKKSLFHDNF